MINIMRWLNQFVIKLIIYVFIILLNAIDIILAMFYVIAEKISRLLLFGIVLSVLISNSFREFVICGEWWQIGVKVLLIVLPIALVKIVPPFLMKRIAKIENYLLLQNI